MKDNKILMIKIKSGAFSYNNYLIGSIIRKKVSKNHKIINKWGPLRFYFTDSFFQPSNIRTKFLQSSMCLLAKIE